MNRIAIFFIALFSLASCMSETNYSESFTAYATFEYLGEDYSQLFGADSLYFSIDASDGYESAIGWSVLGYTAKVSLSKDEFVGGFMLSHLKPANDTTDFPASPYRVYGDPAKSNTYMVFHDSPSGLMPGHDIFFTMTTYGTCAPTGCGICNTAEVVNFVKENFEDGDRLVIKATGYLNNNVCGTAEFALADYATFRDSVVTKWTLFDLAKIGDFDYLDFAISSTKEGVPPYFCLDDFIAQVAIEY